MDSDKTRDPTVTRFVHCDSTRTRRNDMIRREGTVFEPSESSKAGGIISRWHRTSTQPVIDGAIEYAVRVCELDVSVIGDEE